MIETLRGIVADVLEIDESEVTEDLTAEDVETWDSLNHLKLMTAIEEELDVRLSMSEIESIDSIKKLLAAIEAHAPA